MLKFGTYQLYDDLLMPVRVRYLFLSFLYKSIFKEFTKKIGLLGDFWLTARQKMKLYLETTKAINLFLLTF